MIRAGFTFAASLAIAGCIPGDRVTLLTHSEGGPVGAVAVLDEDGQDLALANQENQQIRLSSRNPRVRQLDEGDVDPAYRELIGSLPVAASALVLDGFPTGEFSLSEAQKNAIRQHFTGLGDRPGYQIEIRGYTDSEGARELNDEVSQGRADAVAKVIVNELGFEVDGADVLGMGEAEAIRTNGDEVPDRSFRRVDVVIR